MLKRIKVDDVELGMFIHHLEGSWFKHPFWKSKFLLDDARTLEKLQASDVDGVVIDVSKGLDLRPKANPMIRVVAEPIAVPARPMPTAAERLQRRRAPVAAEPRGDLRSASPTSFGREFGLAGTVAGKSRKLISRVFLEARLGKAVKAAQVEPVVDDIYFSIQRNPHAFNGLMRCKRDNEHVYRHALAVCALMITLARQMKLPAQTVRDAGTAGLLMDVGIGLLPVDLGDYGGDYRNVPDEILRQHIALGHQFLEAGGDLPQCVLDVALRHHETLDGKGYPLGLAGDGIDQLSRMAAICDTYDSMVSDTADGTGINPASAIQQMRYMKDMFDEDILDHLTAALGIYPTGSVVQLASGYLALVINQDPAEPACPQVRVFWSLASGSLVKPHTVTLSRELGRETIVAAVDPRNYPIGDFPRLRQRLFEGAARDSS
ncbi:MAG TPA: DUF3391 domain-containing protein [Novosphingobium sp.]|nr:DUF3391 domain-containing protein [Novosphingobium sp.]